MRVYIDSSVAFSDYVTPTHTNTILFPACPERMSRFAFIPMIRNISSTSSSVIDPDGRAAGTTHVAWWKTELNHHHNPNRLYNQQQTAPSHMSHALENIYILHSHCVEWEFKLKDRNCHVCCRCLFVGAFIYCFDRSQVIRMLFWLTTKKHNISQITFDNLTNHFRDNNVCTLNAFCLQHVL